MPDDDEEAETQETQELMEKGAIPTTTYWQYYRAGGTIAVLLFLILLLVIAQASCNASDLWLTYWTNMEQLRTSSSETTNGNDSFTNQLNISEADAITPTTTLAVNLTTDPSNVTFDVPSSPLPFNITSDTRPEDMMSQSTYIIIYSILILLSIILTTARSFLFFRICMNASKRLHNLMFSNVLQATMRFFDTNPSGRILNRFSKDMGAMDELLPRAMIEAIQIFLVMAGILTMVFIVTPWMVAVAIVLGLLFYWFRVIYLASAQDVKRLEGISTAIFLYRSVLTFIFSSGTSFLTRLCFLVRFTDDPLGERPKYDNQRVRRLARSTH